MPIPELVYAALSGLVGGRVSPMEQAQSDGLAVWPAIRYSIVDVVPGKAVCGDGGDDSTADVRLQVDLIAVGFDEVEALYQQVRAAMHAGLPYADLESKQNLPDPETRTSRVVLDYIVYL